MPRWVTALIVVFVPLLGIAIADGDILMAVLFTVLMYGACLAGRADGQAKIADFKARHGETESK